MIVKVTIEEVLRKNIEVHDVESIEEAIKRIEDEYDNGEIILDADDFSGQYKITGKIEPIKYREEDFER